MRNLILLVRRFWNLILFVILLLIAVSLIVKNKSIQGQTIVSSSNRIVGYLYKKQANINQYFHLKALNEDLARDQQFLLESLKNLEATDSFQNMLAQLPDTIVPVLPPEYDTLIVEDEIGEDSMVLKPIKQEKIAITYTDYEYIPVRVIKNSISQSQVNYLTLNRGSKDGIQKGMAVVTAQGIVGRVAGVSKHFSTVASVLSSRKIHARLDNGSPGFIYWEATDPDIVRMDNLSILDSLSIGMKVHTSGYSYFPANILIGEVVDIQEIETTNTKSVWIKLSIDFRRLDYAYVVKNKKAVEQEILEEEME